MTQAVTQQPLAVTKSVLIRLLLSLSVTNNVTLQRLGCQEPDKRYFKCSTVPSLSCRMSGKTLRFLEFIDRPCHHDIENRVPVVREFTGLDSGFRNQDYGRIAWNRRRIGPGSVPPFFQLMWSDHDSDVPGIVPLIRRWISVQLRTTTKRNKSKCNSNVSIMLQHWISSDSETDWKSLLQVSKWIKWLLNLN